MNIEATATQGRLRLTHGPGVPDTRISGVNPDMTGGNIVMFVNALSHIQTVIVDRAFLTVESDLEPA